MISQRKKKITYNKLLRGDWYQMSETPEWEILQWLFDKLQEEFHFTDAIRLMKNQMSPREALIYIGSYYFQLKYGDLEKIFRGYYAHIKACSSSKAEIIN